MFVYMTRMPQGPVHNKCTLTKLLATFCGYCYYKGQQLKAMEAKKKRKLSKKTNVTHKFRLPSPHEVAGI